MSNESRWLAKLGHDCSCDFLVVKTFYKTKRGKIWFKEDLHKDEPFTINAIIGFAINTNYKYYDILHLKADNLDARKQPLVVEYPFGNVGTCFISLKELAQDKYDSLCKSIFVQMMLAASKGQSVIYAHYGQEITLVQANNEFNALIECDSLVDE